MQSRSRNAAALAVALALAAVGLAAPGCGTDAVGIEACRSIETARCKNAPNCGVDIGFPVHRGSPGTDVDACIAYYRDECLHGLQSGKDPGTAAVNACVARINDSSAHDYCTAVQTPELVAECAFVAANAADAAATDATDAAADAFGGCPAGCTDFGVQFCDVRHLCACPAAVASLPTNCTPTSTTVSGGGVGYCCQ